MVARDTVRDAHSAGSPHSTAPTRAVTNYDRTFARRAEVLTEHDSLLVLAQEELGRTVATMAAEISADLTATLLGLDIAGRCSGHPEQIAESGAAMCCSGTFLAELSTTTVRRARPNRASSRDRFSIESYSARTRLIRERLASTSRSP
jgi:hypothetical protein